MVPSENWSRCWRRICRGWSVLWPGDSRLIVDVMRKRSVVIYIGKNRWGEWMSALWSAQKGSPGIKVNTVIQELQADMKMPLCVRDLCLEEKVPVVDGL